MDGLAIDLPGLPTFNGDDNDYIVTGFDGWDDGAKPDAVFAPNGGGPGVVTAGSWLPAESYLTIAGSVIGPKDAQMEAKKILLASLPFTRESVIVVHDVDQDRQAFVRRYDRATFAIGPTFMDFTIPLMMADPYKYGVLPVGGSMGVFTGQSWFRTYTAVVGTVLPDVYTDNYSGMGTPWTRQYAQPGGTGPWVRNYQQAEADGPYPDTLPVESLGTVESRRVTIQVVGPVTASKWWLYNLSTGQRQWGKVTLAAGQVLRLDSLNRKATVDGLDASHLIFGDWLSLVPGSNSFRLAAPQRSAAFATVEALEAFE